MTFPVLSGKQPGTEGPGTLLSSAQRALVAGLLTQLLSVPSQELFVKSSTTVDLRDEVSIFLTHDRERGNLTAFLL